MMVLCGCGSWCGDDGDVAGPGVCKGLPVKVEPLVDVGAAFSLTLVCVDLPLVSATASLWDAEPVSPGAEGSSR